MQKRCKGLPFFWIIRTKEQKKIIKVDRSRDFLAKNHGPVHLIAWVYLSLCFARSGGIRSRHHSLLLGM